MSIFKREKRETRFPDADGKPALRRQGKRNKWILSGEVRRKR